jgi:hypothetical protein
MNITKQNLDSVIKLTYTGKTGICEKYVSNQEEIDEAMAFFTEQDNTDFDAIKENEDKERATKVKNLKSIYKKLDIKEN